MKKKLPQATEGFLTRQKRRPRRPTAKIKQKVGEWYRTPSGVIYEVVELYGGMIMMKLGVEVHLDRYHELSVDTASIEEVLDRATTEEMRDPESLYSYLWVHDFKKYKKVKNEEL